MYLLNKKNSNQTKLKRNLVFLKFFICHYYSLSHICKSTLFIDLKYSFSHLFTSQDDHVQ